MNNKHYTKEELLWLKNYYKNHNRKETIEAFNKYFNTNRSASGIGHILTHHFPKKSIHTNYKYTQEQIDYVKTLAKIPNIRWKEILSMYNKQFNKTEKESSFKSHFSHLKRIRLIKNKDYKYTRKCVHKEGDEYIRYHYKNGVVIRTDVYIRLKNEHKHNKSILKRRYIWEKYNGPIPKGCIIIHLDGNSLNCDISNLRCVDKGTSKRILGNKHTPNFYGKNKITEAYIECMNLEKIINKER